MYDRSHSSGPIAKLSHITSSSIAALAEPHLLFAASAANQQRRSPTLTGTLLPPIALCGAIVAILIAERDGTPAKQHRRYVGNQIGGPTGADAEEVLQWGSNF